MAIASAHGTGALQARTRSTKAQTPWWVTAIATQAAPSTAVPFYIQAPNAKAATGIIGGPPLAGPFATKHEAEAWVKRHASDFGPGKTNVAPPSAPGAADLPKGGGWLGSIGGMIASGIEQGFVSVLKDLWAVIEGPVLILAGVLIAVIALGIYFKNDISAAVAFAPK